MKHFNCLFILTLCFLLMNVAVVTAEDEQEEGGSDEGEATGEEDGEATDSGETAAAEVTTETEEPAAVEETAEEVDIYGGDYAEVEEEYGAQGDEEAEARSSFSLNGFLETQGGIFVSTEENEVDDEGYPTDHGGHFGEPSIFRNTLQLVADWQPMGQVNVHAIFRGVRSASLLADRYAQVPTMRADTTYNHDEIVQDNKRKWVAEHYYQENDLRELYVDIYPTDWLSFRMGRQQVAWGETANARLMDMINPIDSTWHLGVFEAYEDQRIPLWIAKSLIDIAPLNAGIEVVFAPMIDDPEDTVTVPLTFVGAWGLPLAPKNDYLSDLVIVQKKMVYPDNDLEDTRWGVNWKQIIGPLTYTLAYFHGHQLSPPVPAYVDQLPTLSEDGKHEVIAYLTFPRQDTYGASFEFSLPRPISTVVKAEGTFMPDYTYSANSYMYPGFGPDGGEGWRRSPENPDNLRADIYTEDRDTWSYAVVLQRPNQIRFLNPTSSIITQFQLIQTIIPGGPYIDEELGNGETRENENWYLVSIPGYDCSKISEIQTIYAAGILTSYAHGIVSPFILALYDENSKSGILSAALNFSIGNSWRMKVAYNMVEAYKPYSGLGLFRDRDEVNLRIRYQF